MIQTLKKNKYHIVFAILLLIGTVELMAKSKYGFGDVDEPFYLSIPLRMVNGDKLFLNEWNLSQMTGILLYPFVKVYMMIKGSTVGMILTFRRVYICVQALACIIFYLGLKKYSHVAAIVYSIVFLLYAPLSIMALSYNTLGIIFMALVALLVLENGKMHRFYFAGVFFAGAVLCDPYLVFLYVCIFVAILLNRNPDSRKLHLKQFGFYTLGAFTVLIVFLIVVFSQISVGEFIASLRPILLGDAGHTGNLDKKPITFLLEVFLVYKKALIVYAVYLILIVLSRKASIQRKNKYTLIAVALTIPNIYFVSERILFNYMVNAFTIPLSALCVYLVGVYRDRLDLSIFKKVWLPGVVYAFTLHVASDNGIATITIAGTLMMMATLIYLADVYRIIKAEGIERDTRLFKIIVLVLFTCQIVTMGVFRWISIYWDKPVWYQTTLIEQGPEKGIIASEEKAADYNQIYEEMQSLDKSKKTLFFTSRTWMYLVDDYENCSFSSWIWNISSDTVVRFETYYEMNPEKKPEVIYIDYVNAQFATDWQEYGYTIIDQTPSGGVVLAAQ